MCGIIDLYQWFPNTHGRSRARLADSGSVLKYALQRFRFKKVCSYRVVDFSWRCGGCTEEGMSHHSPGRVQAGFAKVIMLGEGLSGE